MTAQILASELGNLIQESKRKHADLRNAAEKSLDEIKGLRATSEAQIAADLSQRPNFVTPFLIACGTKNVKYTSIAIVCLQRLVVSGSLPRSRLKEVLDAFREATPAGLDVQLKILQALPSLLQNYAEDLKGDLIAASLNICTILQASKNAIVINTAAATLQQLVVSVFDKVVVEDKIALELPMIGEAPVEDGSIRLRAAAMDAYRVFNDLCLLTESQKPQFLRSAGLPQTFGLELIESVLTNHAQVFVDHAEQAHILRVRVMPFIISALSEKLNFAVTVRIVRILYTLLRNHLSILSSEGEMSLGLLTHMLDHDTALWKRSLCMEALRGIFADAALVRKIFAMYDAQEEKKDILRDLVAAFVRLSSEKPALIGLGPQSTVPVTSQGGSGSDQAILEASGVPGIISSSVGSNDPPVGVSSQWSTIRVPCIDQLDKTEPPSIPESYIYSLTLACINGFSEGLAKFILPLTVPERPRKKGRQLEVEETLDSTPGSPGARGKLERRSSTKKNPVSVNPLDLGDHPLYEDVKICAGIVEHCWPAILATCSTFLYAALDSEYYHGLVRSFQKFTHVAGLLRLATPRDAFLTTLGKAAVPSNILTAQTPIGPPSSTPATEKQSIFSNAKGLLSVDSSASHSSTSDRGRQSSAEAIPSSLNTRNLLCLRALLNLGIALGPTLDSAWAIVLGTLQKADLVLFSSTKSVRTPNQKTDSQSAADGSALLVNFGTEIKAVETAASRLLESTIDFPNDAFVEVITALCSLFGVEEPVKQSDDASSTGPPSPEIRRPSQTHRRLHSVNTVIAIQNQEDLFALAKLGDVAGINIGRLMNYDPETSGWAILTSELTSAACSPSTPSSVRLRAAEILVRLVLEAATATLSLPEELRSNIQLRLLKTFRKAIRPLESSERQLSVAMHTTDIDVHKIILEGLKSILEQCGETYVVGWDIAFDIIGSVFAQNDAPAEENAKRSRASTTRSARLIRSSFNSLQLICSDFLSSLPNSCFIMLVDTLYNFCTQDDDLNISLTTVTFFWVLSDFISGRTHSFSLSSDLMKGVNEGNLAGMASGDDLAVSDAALWMLLLLRLTAVTTDDRLELRNSAIQTLFRIFDAYGDQLSPEAWSICLKSVMFKLLSSIEEQLQITHDVESEASDKDRTGWNETTVVVLSGITNLLADYLEVVSSHASFGESWQALLNHLQTLLDLNILEINTAVFKSLREILSRGNLTESSTTNFSGPSLDLAWGLWSTSLPVVKPDPSNKRFDNQNYLLAYSSALQEIYRLIQADIDDERVHRMLTLLRESIQQASAATYSADVEYLTPLQTQVLECLKMIRTDIDGVPAALIGQVADFVGLAFEPRDTSGSDTQRPTYVALSKASMTLLENLIIAHSNDEDIYGSGALSSALTALARPIVLKYSFPLVTKSISPWRQATTSSLAILKSVLPILTKAPLKEDVTRSLWTSIVTIANGITNADCSSLSPTISIQDDQDFDITSFLAVRTLITPALGSPTIPDKPRMAYTKSLFHMSLIHAPHPSELPQPNQELLATLYQQRKGRTVDPGPTPRVRMSYVCFDELVSLITLHDSSDARIKLAQAAAPYLILRTGLTLRAYIADQPLRGRIPQPRSQRKELLYILQALVKLNCEPEAIPETTGVDSDVKKHLFWLYPLLAKAVRAAARDMEVLEWVGRALDVVGGEFGLRGLS